MLLRAMEEWKEGSTGCTNDNDQVSQNDVILSSNFAHGRSNDRSGYNIGNFKHTKIVNKIGLRDDNGDKRCTNSTLAKKLISLLR